MLMARRLMTTAPDLGHEPRLFVKLDGFIRRRLRAFLRTQSRNPGFGICCADHQRWPNAFFANEGLFTLHTAYQQARRSR
jgi:RNA-directed DNA polymerase